MDTMEGLHRSQYCAEVSEADNGKEVVLMRLGRTPPRPRRTDFHRPPRPYGHRAGRRFAGL
jgi:hypothetical protein